jgi:UV DNA damage endonuclease
LKLLKWNKDHHIECLRLSSEIFPHYSNIRYIKEQDRYNLDFVKDELKKIGEYVINNNMRVTFHPGQFNCIGSPNDVVLQSTICDLKMHADILDLMLLPLDSCLVVHGGGIYGDKDKTIKRWINNFNLLPDNVKNRLVIENCEKNFNIKDCLYVSKQLNIPIVFDNHHFNCYSKLHPEEKFESIEIYIEQVIETWTKLGRRPKFHLSEQNENKTHCGAHSNYIEVLPKYYLDIPIKYNIGIDIMIEAKAKEAAILNLYKKYKNELLSHLNKQDIPKDMFNIDIDKQSALICSRCNLNFTEEDK